MKLPLRYILVFSSLFVLLATVGFVQYSNYTAGRFAVRDLSDQVLNGAALRVNEAVERLLQTATQQSDVAERLLRREMSESSRTDITAADFPRLLPLFESIVAATPEISYLSVGLEKTGEYCHVFRRPDGVLEQQECVRQPNGTMSRTDYQWRNGKRERVQFLAATDYDPRQRPYYKQAKNAEARVWTDTYSFRVRKGPEVPGITCATPIKRADGTLLGVLSADFTLEDLSKFTRTILIGKTGYAFILERRQDGTRRVIAHPDASIVGTESSKDPALSAFLQEIRLGKTAQKSQLLRFHRDKAQYLGNVQVLSDANLPRWLLCSLVPEAEVMERVEQSAMQSRFVVLGGILAGTLVSVLLSSRITNLIARVISETEKIRRLDLDARPMPKTRVREFDDLGADVERMKAGLRSFEKFVPPEVVKQLVGSGLDAELHGERRVLSVAFLDIVQFTAFAESTPPDELIGTLGEILDALSNRISEQHGTVDKYIGDEIMALWGAPEYNPDHATNACLAAIRCQQALADLRKRWEVEGKPPLFARIGLNTGEVIVGVMGSHVRFSYTALGDPVNLCKRLESLNSLYGTSIIASDATIQAAGENIVSRPLDLVTVVGRREPVLVYEVMGVRGELSADEERLAEITLEAMSHYRARRWPDAVAALEKALQLCPNDTPARLLLDSCRDFADAPPSTQWDGVRRMEKK